MGKNPPKIIAGYTEEDNHLLLEVDGDEEYISVGNEDGVMMVSIQHVIKVPLSPERFKFFKTVHYSDYVELILVYNGKFHPETEYKIGVSSDKKMVDEFVKKASDIVLSFRKNTPKNISPG